ncbi:LysR substrate-binding domain-containing protein [Phenylobacterium sp.]|jgi:DNA-binding transcriptional LysR family regulator|uniref:LysR substrate-binding domain-containing protein n=1 Tax=Phenylobacterium sp. TaxID=1871053 RepID=UPI0037C6F105
MAVNLQHLRTFHAVAIEGSISRAARRLNVSQPTLSQQLKALEERHGVTLFDGRKPPLRLSALGRDLFAISQRLFAASTDVDELLGEARGLDASVNLRIASDSPPYAARLIAGFHRRHVDASISLRVGNAREVIAALREGQADVAIASDPPGDPLFAYEPLFADNVVLALQAGHPLTAEASLPIHIIRDEILLRREASSRTRVASERVMSVAGVEPRGVIDMHTREAVREGIALGLGVGFFYSSECPPDQRIAYRPIEGLRPNGELNGYVVCLADRRRSALIREVMVVAEALRPLSPCPLAPRGAAA